jgi:hypothetical protein
LAPSIVASERLDRHNKRDPFIGTKLRGAVLPTASLEFGGEFQYVTHAIPSGQLFPMI